MVNVCTQPAVLNNYHDTWLPLKLIHNCARVQVLNSHMKGREKPPLASEGVTVQDGRSHLSDEVVNLAWASEHESFG